MSADLRPVPGGTTAKPLLAEDIGIAALPHVPYEAPLRALCKPAFSEFESGLFLCGTEDQASPQSNQLVVGVINFESKRTQWTEVGTPCIWTHSVPDHVRDVAWVSKSHALLALGSRLALAHVSGAVPGPPAMNIVMLPEQHTDTVREIAPHPLNKHVVASCGFDGRVFVTDLLKVGQSSQTKEPAHVVTYDCGESASSVTWRPDDGFGCSVSTDNGKLHIFDIRADLKRPALRFSADRGDLNCHVYTDMYRLMLGFGDGMLQLHDIRRGGCIHSMQDPYQTAVGDVRCLPNSTGLTLVTCGHPGLSVWAYTNPTAEKPELRVASHHRAAGIDFASKTTYKISGAFVPGTRLFAAADSLGSMLILDTTDVC